MKGVEEQLEIERQKYITAETKKGFNEAAILTVWKESVMNADTVEHKLSKAKKLNSTAGISESAPITESRKITRNNGSQIVTENDSKSRDERIVHFMEGNRMNYTEACYMIGEKPEAGEKQPASITESIITKWRKYAPWLSLKDARTLAEMGKLP